MTPTFLVKVTEKESELGTRETRFVEGDHE